MKGGTIYSDYLTTVSRKYAQEIPNPEFGSDWMEFIGRRAQRLVGILNGVDYSE